MLVHGVSVFSVYSYPVKATILFKIKSLVLEVGSLTNVQVLDQKIEVVR